MLYDESSIGSRYRIFLLKSLNIENLINWIGVKLSGNGFKGGPENGIGADCSCGRAQFTDGTG